MVNESLKRLTGKEKRKRPGSDQQEGAALAAQTGRKRRKATLIDDLASGSVELAAAPARRKGLLIKWAALGEHVIGKFDMDAKAVLLNIENAFIRDNKAAGNTAALYAVAIGLVCHSDASLDGRQPMLICKGTFSEEWGRVMSTLRIEVANGK